MATKAPAKAVSKAPVKKAVAKPSTVLGSQGPSAAQQKKWQAEDDLRTLQRAGEIKNDPARVKMAQAEAQAQMKALATVVKK